MAGALDSAAAEQLRSLVARVLDAVEARIRGEESAGEQIRRATQAVQIAGMGAPEYWLSQLLQPLKSVCICMAQEMKLFPLLNEQGTASISAQDMASKTGYDALLISRIMRILSNVGLCEETDHNTYRSSQVSQIVASNGGMAGVKVAIELLFPIAAKVVPYMREHGFKQFPNRPEEQDVVQYTHGKMMWQYLKEQPEYKHWFDTMMAENRRFMKQWFSIYPVEVELQNACASPEDVLIVDVGGSRGADLIELQQVHPSLTGRLIVQDLPETIDAIDRSTFPSRIEAQAYDFFTPQPVEGAKVYFWRWVAHDWDDENVRKFLGNTVRVMAKDSKMLLQEFVLPDVQVDMKNSHTDILMMLYHSGMERTLSQWKVLLDSCGLDIVKIWPSGTNYDPSVIECRKKDA